MEKPRDSSTSTTNFSPRTPSLHESCSRPNDIKQSHQVTTHSPLGLQSNTSAPVKPASRTGDDVLRQTTSTSPRDLPTTEGFPFNVSVVFEQPYMDTSQHAEKIDEVGATHSNDAKNAMHTKHGSLSIPSPHEAGHAIPKTLNRAGSATPPPRRSVQFVRPSQTSEQTATFQSRTSSWDVVDGETLGKDRKGKLFSRLKSLAGSTSSQSHIRSPSNHTLGGDSIDERFVAGPSTPIIDRSDNRVATAGQEDDSEVDADGEQSTGEENVEQQGQRSKRRKSRRPVDGGPQTAPTTPKTLFLRDGRPNLFLSSSHLHSDSFFRPSFLPRRATMTDVPIEDRQGVSEDEGRDRLARGSPWRRGSGWVGGPRGLSYGGSRKSNQQSNNGTPRPSSFRRLTGFGGPSEGPDGNPLSPWKLRGERTSTLSAAKWRQLKTSLKLIGQKRKTENTIDHAKSAELIAELTAGVPAALILASMFQRDEHGNKRIPVLLEQLKVQLTDSRQVDSRSGDRHMVFRIEMEYGNGPTRMKWIIHRALRDFVNLHARYKFQLGAQKYIQLKANETRTKLPHFPRSAFPYLNGVRGIDSESEGDEDPEVEGTGPSGGEISGTERPGKRRKKHSSMNIIRRKSSINNDPLDRDNGSQVDTGTGALSSAVGLASSRKDPFAERQRRKLETYLQQMIRYLVFRPESNRLCKFLELSALGVRLAAEASYHGKEGYLIIQSGKGIDFRRAWTPSLIKGRHGPKWFLVRHSYVVCVDSPEEMNIYDVFLVDSKFSIQTKKNRLPIRDQKAKDLAKSAKESAKHPQHHSLKLFNSERKLRLLAKNERQLGQFEDSIRFMAQNTPWANENRFDSFAPVRSNVFAQWLVDGRDYMWNVSRAISMAKDVIYIHDWWLSPELYMRRPAAISQKWRLDRLLQRKAQEGVKVFVIVYRNINSAIPIDSEYTKFSLLDLHPNVFVQRSPNQIRQGTFFWAHHEKICIVDHIIAFVGGIDLCFGRWDTPQHTVVDDKLTGFELSDMPKDADHCQLWPGKDYSNPRVQDFYALDKPYEEMYDRSKVPRMPWHDISMQVVGQPARDLTRHFVQRWNYILRQRKPTRPTPFLLPPPDFNSADLEALGLEGTCEVQILRSCATWSIGTKDLIEHSIQNAYVKMIEQSEHFVYVENQFFISSSEIEGTRIENGIGDALVERIIRASRNEEDWRAVLMIPLVPGFQNTVDSQEGTSVRLIMQCQYRSICRGENSIFGRLRAEGIEPEDFIQFYSLRSWGKIGPNKELVTEQLYIHAKCIVVDDRIALIGSANINERSMRGDRDSECAAVVRDTDMLWSTMNGEPYLVGRFPHTLRMRLMREHLGIDVDEVMDGEREELIQQEHEKWEREMDDFHGIGSASQSSAIGEQCREQTTNQAQADLPTKSENLRSFNHDVDWEEANNPHLKTDRKLTYDSRVTHNLDHRKDVRGEGVDRMLTNESKGIARGRDPTLQDIDRKALHLSTVPNGEETVSSLSADRSSKRSLSHTPDNPGNFALPPLPELPRMTSVQLGLPMVSQLPALPPTDDTDIGGPSIHRVFSQKISDMLSPALTEMKHPIVSKDCMRDPLNDTFYFDTWHTIAENNTKLFRTVFRCMPDNEVRGWKEYQDWAAYSERFSQAQGGGKSRDRLQQEAPGTSGPPGQGIVSDKLRMMGSNQPMGTVEDWAAEANKLQAERQEKERKEIVPSEETGIDEKNPIRKSNETAKNSQDRERLSKYHSSSAGYPEAANLNHTNHKRRKRATTRNSKKEFHASDDLINPTDAEELLKMVQGHLILWPYDWYVSAIFSIRVNSPGY